VRVTSLACHFPYPTPPAEAITVAADGSLTAERVK